MSKKIARLLKTDVMADMDMPALAQILASRGRGGDSMLAHITPKEAALLRKHGGAGTVNPDTGLQEFYDWTGNPMSDVASTETSAPPVQPVDVYSQQSGMFDFPGGFEQAMASVPEMPVAPAAPVQQFGMMPQIPDQFAAPPISPDIAAPAAAAPEESFFDKTKKYLTKPGQGGVTPLERLGVAGLSAIPGIYQARQAAAQGQAAKQEQQKLARPYQEQGKQLVAQAQRGELTAPNQQQIQAMQARMAQNVAARGGVGADQAANQLEAFRQQLLANQYDLGLKVSGIGDQIAIGAIKTGLQADQYVNQLTNSYYNNIFRMMGGQPQQTTTTTVTR
jgi:hypothetical protein